MKNGWIFIFPLLLLGIIGFPGCENCSDCGPGQGYPYVNVRFYNIDSLAKINHSISVVSDSIAAVQDRIDQGADSLADVLNQLQDNLGFLENIRSNINNGKIKIDKVLGSGSGHTLYFRDSTTHDSLTVFRFPLAMDNQESEYFITIGKRTDTLGVKYKLFTVSRGPSIIRSAYDLSVLMNTYDSVKLYCKTDTCFSNDATISVYF